MEHLGCKFSGFLRNATYNGKSVEEIVVVWPSPKLKI